MELNDLIDAIEDLIEPVGKGELRRRPHNPAGNKTNASRHKLDDPVPGETGTGINTEDPEHGQRSAN
jgi:hypothetical protein